ncbi:MAG: hypothetical protein ABI778_07375 [Ignavibacteriota bacterium]
MIYNIQEGQFNREAIVEACNARGFQILKDKIFDAPDMSEKKYFAWVKPSTPQISPGTLWDLESELSDNEGEEGFFSLDSSVSPETIEITVFN